MIERTNIEKASARFLEIHCDGSQQSLDLHVLDPVRLALANPWSVFEVPRACDPPAVADADRMFIFTPCRAIAPGACGMAAW